jgi:hypothetical protein
MSISVNSPEQWDDGPDELTDLFAAYREACPDVPGGADFLPGIWRKIEGRQSLWFSFEHLARGFAAVAVAMCLLLVVLNFTSSQANHVNSVSYPDALAAEHTVERTFYAEGIRTTPPDNGVKSPAR